MEQSVIQASLRGGECNLLFLLLLFTPFEVNKLGIYHIPCILQYFYRLIYILCDFSLFILSIVKDNLHNVVPYLLKM